MHPANLCLLLDPSGSGTHWASWCDESNAARNAFSDPVLFARAQTKGNLTKHMKSKVHQRKCFELGVVPVPMSVEDETLDPNALVHVEVQHDGKVRGWAGARWVGGGGWEGVGEKGEEGARWAGAGRGWVGAGPGGVGGVVCMLGMGEADACRGAA